MSRRRVRTTAPPQAIVIFGASGDLTRRKLLPAFYHLYLEGLLPKSFAIVGYARTEFTDDEFRDHALASIREFGKHVPEGQVWADFAGHLRYVAGEFTDPGAMDKVAADLEEIDRTHGTEGNRFFYAATPSSAYADVVERIGEAGMEKGSKIIIEKPFGHDLATAMELNKCLHAVFDESQVFRIDHYLGKETVQNILAFRFANGMFEPIWNRRYIEHVQVTVAEQIGIEGRGAFYEQTGAIRDMVSTHLFQMMTFLAMEPPVSFDPDRLRDETVKVLRAADPIDPAHVVLGQYDDYHAEQGVAKDSKVETFVALKLELDNWRWAGVPFFLRTGKGLAQKVTEITLKFRRVPFNVFRETDVSSIPRDHLTIRVQPNEGITLAVNAKQPGPGLKLGRVTMDFDYEREFTSEIVDAYELLLLGAMEGDHTLFIRQDGVERAWELLEPVLKADVEVHTYKRGTWGPAEADGLLGSRKWHISTEEDP